MPQIADDILRSRVSQAAYQRGQRYAEHGAVLNLHWDGSHLSSIVAGTNPAPYRCRISVVQVGSMWIPMAMGCSCPVRNGCKHAVATLLQAREKAREVPEPDWRAKLAGLLPETGRREPLALGFSLKPAAGPSRWQAGAGAPADVEEAYAQGRALQVHLRPLTRGKSRAWIKGGLTWRGLEHELNHNPEHVLWLRQLLGLYDATRTSHGGVDREGLHLEEVRGPMLWPMLQRAPEIGLELVAERGITLHLGEQAHLELQLDRDPHGLALRPALCIDGVDLSGTSWVPIGAHGVYSYRRATSGFEVFLAPTTAPIPPGFPRSGAPLHIPEPEEEEFFDAFLPDLQQRLPIGAGRGVDLPTHQPPALHLELAYHSTDDLEVHWTWQYHRPRRTYPITAGPQELTRRDPTWEAATWRAVEAVWPPAGQVNRLTGVEVAEFTAEILPELERLAGVVVEASGDRPEFTRLAGHPHIKITTVETDRTDWFDLGFEITVDGRRVPFTHLFAALSKGKKKLLLPDRSYLSLQHTAFDALRELLNQAEEMAEWEPENPVISKYQVDFWADFEDLADEAVPARAWREAVTGLRDLTAIESVPLSPGVNASLRPYQQEGLDWLAFLWRHNLGGILADDMGLGKTLQTLALIAHASAPAPFLIVAPTSVTSTWASEAARFTPELNVVVIGQTRRKRRVPLSEAVAGADVVVTSYAIARLDAEEFTAGTWAGLVLDEAQFVKNPATRVHREIAKIPAPFRLAITGTPMENSLTDLWALTSITAPGLFASGRKFRERYVRPIENNSDAERLAELRRKIRPFMLRRTKEQVAADLPPKQEQVLAVELSGRHRKLYDTILQRERQKVLGLIEDLDRNRFIVFRSLTLLRMLALAPGLVGEEHAGIESAKLDTLIDHIEGIAAEGHRVLVFSQFTSFLTMAAERCTAAGLEYEYLDGSTRNRAGVIERFRTGTAPVFFISLKAGGFGLTLTEADYVFMLDPWWNPAAETQAVDRTHRIGQTKNVMVYRLVASDTIEEKVMALQRKKSALFTAVVDDDAHFSRQLTAEDVRQLFD